uniref:Uncharacterized protein LOC116940113 n=1 Tax=Petromyzon marinus TaxID=7757 RepID=A0AAJ7SVF1_PETMA|nr:uncharacterized protein LOC116940113 [Petromyzon marinus]
MERPPHSPAERTASLNTHLSPSGTPEAPWRHQHAGRPSALLPGGCTPTPMQCAIALHAGKEDPVFCGTPGHGELAGLLCSSVKNSGHMPRKDDQLVESCGHHTSSPESSLLEQALGSASALEQVQALVVGEVFSDIAATCKLLSIPAGHPPNISSTGTLHNQYPPLKIFVTGVSHSRTPSLCRTAGEHRNPTQKSARVENRTYLFLAVRLEVLLPQRRTATSSMAWCVGAVAVAADPLRWSGVEASRWLAWAERHYSLPRLGAAFSGLRGAQLCLLGEGDFRARAPAGGELLHAHLDIWKTAAKLQDASAHDSNLARHGAGLNREPHADDRDLRDPAQDNIGTGGLGGGKRCSVSGFSLCGDACRTSSRRHRLHVGREPQVRRSTDVQRVTADTIWPLTCVPAPLGSTHTEGPPPTRAPELPRAQPPVPPQPIHLWQFLWELLLNPRDGSRLIRWLNRDKGIFKIEDSVEVARLWGIRKNRPAMNYDKLSRSIRQYYKKGIIRKTEISQRLVYQFVHPL